MKKWNGGVLVRKNEFLYDFLYAQLTNGAKLTFAQIDELAKRTLGDVYNQKQLRNLIYHLVLKKELSQEGNQYYRVQERQEDNIISEYLNELETICRKTERKLKNPFENYHGQGLLEAEKLYRINKEVLKLIKSYE